MSSRHTISWKWSFTVDKSYPDWSVCSNKFTGRTTHPFLQVERRESLICALEVLHPCRWHCHQLCDFRFLPMISWQVEVAFFGKNQRMHSWQYQGLWCASHVSSGPSARGEDNGFLQGVKSTRTRNKACNILQLWFVPHATWWGEKLIKIASGARDSWFGCDGCWMFLDVSGWVGNSRKGLELGCAA